jgi:putative spermidine/putrescine transport system ATP-binding protein
VPYVELHGLRRVFNNEVVALDGIDVALEPGEFLSLLGPSGCGKTTALRIVAGFDRPTAGRVVVDGKDISNVPPNRRNMGMVFQAYSLFPNLTAEKNVEFGLRIRRQDRTLRRRRVAELLELVGLGHAADRYPHQLSGGMQQRVALARALAIEPRVLLLDEPLSALDAKVRVQLREEIRRIQLELGITTIYVTHDQEEALSISDRVAVLYRGKIEQIGTPADMYGSPETPFVAEFIGTMNRLPATVAAEGWVEHGGSRLRVDAARGWAPGDRVLLLVRPETMELAPADGDAPAEGDLAGTVLTHTFLGASTRVRVETGGSELTADVPTARAGQIPIGTRVRARFPADAARLLALDADAEEIVAAAAAAAAEEA